MLKIDARKNSNQLKADLYCLYLFESAKPYDLTSVLNKSLKSKIEKNIVTFQFKGKSKETLLLEGTESIKRVLIIGLGKKKEMSDDVARLALSIAIKKANQLKVESVISAIPAVDKYLVPSVEGAFLADYQFSGYHQKEDKNKVNTAKKLSLLTINKTAGGKVDQLSVVFKAVNQCKDLVNSPSNIVTPTYLEKEAQKIAKINKKAELKVLSEEDAEKENMGGFLAVSKGSEEPAKMIVLSYKGNPRSKQVYGVIGKGITFDSGGLSLKPANGMSLMKSDMAGSAATLAVFRAAIELELKVNLVCIVAAAENMPGGKAYRPSDVITASNGKTIEVTNTDAEGRMVLCDALVYAQKLGVTKAIDIATLTGACIVTFGNVHTGLMANSDEWAKTYLESAGETGEKAWQLPMDKEYGELIKSDISDMINANENRKAGTIVGGKFLEHFIKKGTDWIHLDIAGTSYLDADSGYLQKHSTGVPVRTIINLLQRAEKI